MQTAIAAKQAKDSGPGGTRRPSQPPEPCCPRQCQDTADVPVSDIVVYPQSGASVSGRSGHAARQRYNSIPLCCREGHAKT